MLIYETTKDNVLKAMDIFMNGLQSANTYEKLTSLEQYRNVILVQMDRHRMPTEAHTLSKAYCDALAIYDSQLD